MYESIYDRRSDPSAPELNRLSSSPRPRPATPPIRRTRSCMRHHPICYLNCTSSCMRASVINQQAQAQAQAHSVCLQLAVLADSATASHAH
jgi:hypothetical protein